MTIPQLTGTENETLREFAQIESDFGRVLFITTAARWSRSRSVPHTSHRWGPRYFQRWQVTQEGCWLVLVNVDTYTKYIQLFLVLEPMYWLHFKIRYAKILWELRQAPQIVRLAVMGWEEDAFSDAWIGFNIFNVVQTLQRSLDEKWSSLKLA